MVVLSMELRNKTRRPIRVPLPGGKRLHIGPGGTGQISPKATTHPPLKKLLDAGDLEIEDLGRSKGTGGSGGSTGTRPSKGGGSGGVRHTGDR